MSLKSKIEAVIYAAEEPVTLAQLTALFSAEALEYKAAREAAAAEALAKSEPGANEASPLLDEGFAYLGLESTPASFTAPSGEEGGLPVVVPPELEIQPEAARSTEHSVASEPDAELAAAADAENPASSVETTPTEAEGTADPEAERKRETRARDREVRRILEELIEELKASFASDDRGIEIREIAGGYRMATKPECHDAVRMFIRSLKPPLKLSLQALETLAVVAYKQPVTAPEVSEIRGVESAGTLGSLLSRKLIATAGRKPVIGRPILYKTTREFLLRFGLKDVSELPSIEEFEKMAAIELDEQPGAEDGDAETAEMKEEASLQARLDDAFERTNDEAGEEAGAGDETQPVAGSSVEEGQPAQQEPAPNESGAAEPAETEASTHGEKT